MFKRKYVRKIIILVILLCVSVKNVNIFDHVHPFSNVIAHPSPWNTTLHITETTGAGNSLTLGEAIDASNGKDAYDVAEPPAPPQLPNIRAWFTTPFSPPFNNLLHEYKQYPAQQAEWNLTILWTPEPNKNHTTNITIHWSADELAKSRYTSIKLFENNKIVADMLTQTEYVFPSNTSIHRYHIICQNESTTSIPESINVHYLLLLSAVALISIIILFVFKKKKR